MSPSTEFSGYHFTRELYVSSQFCPLVWFLVSLNFCLCRLFVPFPLGRSVAKNSDRCSRSNFLCIHHSVCCWSIIKFFCCNVKSNFMLKWIVKLCLLLYNDFFFICSTVRFKLKLTEFYWRRHFRASLKSSMFLWGKTKQFALCDILWVIVLTLLYRRHTRQVSRITCVTHASALYLMHK